MKIFLWVAIVCVSVESVTSIIRVVHRRREIGRVNLDKVCGIHVFFGFGEMGRDGSRNTMIQSLFEFFEFGDWNSMNQSGSRALV